MFKKTIDTLIYDIHEFLGGKSPQSLSKDQVEDLADRFGQDMKLMSIQRLLAAEDREPRLSPSLIGKPCERQVWLKINKPNMQEVLRPETKMKFLFGDMVEELTLLLCRAAGHSVEAMQDVVEIEGVKGSIDAIIDGTLIDVKSASTFSWHKFANGELIYKDPFGYVGQIQTYLAAAQDHPLLKDKDRCAFLVMDKTLGHVCLDIHPRVDFDVAEITRKKKAMVESAESPPRAYDPVEDGKSGNMKLPMECSYCDMKYACHESLQTYIYSNGPRYLTKVVREPDVPKVEPKLRGMEKLEKLFV